MPKQLPKLHALTVGDQLKQRAVGMADGRLDPGPVRESSDGRRRFYFRDLRESREGWRSIIRGMRVIAHAGRPVAKLIPYSGDGPRRPGIIRTQIIAHDDRHSDR